MTKENATSSTLDFLAQLADGHVPKIMVHYHHLTAIAAKYQAMQEAIEFALDDCSCDMCERLIEEAIKAGKPAKACGMHERLAKALEFDPLA